MGSLFRDLVEQSSLIKYLHTIPLRRLVGGISRCSSPGQVWQCVVLVIPTQQQQHSLAKPLLALLGRNVALLNIADLRRRRALVQMLHELAK
jgi:hypothetical protein